MGDMTARLQGVGDLALRESGVVRLSLNLRGKLRHYPLPGSPGTCLLVFFHVERELFSMSTIDKLTDIC